MPDKGKIFITPLMHVVWHRMLIRALPVWHAEKAAAKAEDREPTVSELPNIAPAIAIQIGSHFNNYTAETYVGQETVAKELGISPRLVWASIKGYRDRGLLVVRHGGRKSNYCGMPVEKVAAECEIYNTKGRSRVRTSPQLSSQNPVLNLAAGCEQTHLPTEDINSTRPNSENDHDHLDPAQLRWAAVKGRLAKRLGAAEMTSWFNRLTLKRMGEHEAVLVAPTKFVCHHIENNYLGDRLLEAWQAEQPTIARVLLITADDAAPTQMAAE